MGSRSRLGQRSLGSPENVIGSSEARNYLYKTAKTKQTKDPDVMHTSVIPTLGSEVHCCPWPA